MPSQLSPPACNRYICTKLPRALSLRRCRSCSWRSRPGPSLAPVTPKKEACSTHPSTSSSGGAWIVARERAAWAAARRGWPGQPRQRLGQARAAEAGAFRAQRPASPWECQAAQSHRARAEGRRRACCATLAQPRRAPCTPHRSPPGEWMKVGWGWGGRMGLELGSASGLG